MRLLRAPHRRGRRGADGENWSSHAIHRGHGRWHRGRGRRVLACIATALGTLAAGSPPGGAALALRPGTFPEVYSADNRIKPICHACGQHARLKCLSCGEGHCRHCMNGEPVCGNCSYGLKDIVKVQEGYADE